MNKEITGHLKTILEEMCSRVGADYYEMDFFNREYPFYMEYEWSIEEQDKFREWLFNYMMDNKDARIELMIDPRKDKKWVREFVNMFILNYGWKLDGNSI
ncbi:MAG: hypothetical protein ACOC80_12225 [Petrotogales bacterium]